jgi:hypothetical protein
MVKIRLATEKDIEKIAEIAVECFPNDFVDGSGTKTKTMENADLDMKQQLKTCIGELMKRFG